jgi:hypothetical protein
MSRHPAVLVCVVSCLTTACMTGHRVGQSTSVEFGRVSGVEQVTLDSNAAQGALIGGTLGLVRGRSDSAVFNAAAGATLGGAATSVIEGERTGYAYTVDLPGGSATRIVSDQREIREGDCVAVERMGTRANIRRTSEGYCDPSNAEALRSVAGSVNTHAAECDKARQALAKATEEEAIRQAMRRTELLCYG